MIVEGRRQTAFSGEKQDAVLRGVVRADDVAANNTVYSYNLADASIQFIARAPSRTTSAKAGSPASGQGQSFLRPAMRRTFNLPVFLAVLLLAPAVFAAARASRQLR